MKIPFRGLQCAAVLASGLTPACLGSQQAAPAPQPNRTVLPLPPAPFRGSIALSYEDSNALTPVLQPPRAPQGAPNILLILLDDAGYGQTGTFGGLIPTPTLDRLAANGLRYTRFHVTAMCSPTRAALLTGRNSHAVGMGVIPNWPSPYPGYTASMPKSAAMISRVLQANGYATAAFGKWHIAPEPECSPAGPFTHWPTQQGFDYFYGFLGGQTDQWHPELVEGTRSEALQPPPGRAGDYTLNDALADKSITWLRQQHAVRPDKPFFVYYAPGATHSPQQAPKAWIERFRGKFDMGWDAYRELVLARQKRLGVIPPDAVLTPRPAEIPAWDSLSPDQKRVAARMMEVDAGFMAQTDYEIGRVIDAVDQMGELNNTIVVYIAGDNGASLEGGPLGTYNAMGELNGVHKTIAEQLAQLDQLGSADTTPLYPAGWAWAGDTPFQWGKRIAAYLGGTRDPMVISWPARIHEKWGVRSQFEDVVDLEPTLLQAARIPEPVQVDGVRQQRVDGISMLATFDDANAPEQRKMQYFETLADRAIYHDGWIAGARSGQLPWVYNPKIDFTTQPWVLYNLTNDYSEAGDLSARFPEKLHQMQSLFQIEAEKNHVYPLDPRPGGRTPRTAGYPTGSAFLTFYAETAHLPFAIAPITSNRSFIITAYVTIPAGGANGVILAEGGSDGGFVLYVMNGHAYYTYNYFRERITTIRDPQMLTAGHTKIELKFDYDGGGRGKAATATLLVNDSEVAQSRIPETVRGGFYSDAFDVGEDSGSAVGNYAAPFAFTGQLDRLDLDLAPPALTKMQQKAAAKDAIRAAGANE